MEINSIENLDGKCGMCRTVMDVAINSDSPVVKVIQCPTHRTSNDRSEFNNRTGSLF